jgi:hypothetical protein
MRLKSLRMIAFRVVSQDASCCRTHLPKTETTNRSQDLPRQFSAIAFAQADAMAGQSFGTNIYIAGWTNNQQVQDYISGLKEKGPGGPVRAMCQFSPTGLWAAAFVLPGIDPQQTE